MSLLRLARSASEYLMAAFRKGLSEIGYVDGQNVSIEFRFAHNQSDRLPELAAELVRRRVAVIVTPGSTPGAMAGKAVTTTIPIIFSTPATGFRWVLSPVSIGPAAISPVSPP